MWNLKNRKKRKCYDVSGLFILKDITATSKMVITSELDNEADQFLPRRTLPPGKRKVNFRLQGRTVYAGCRIWYRTVNNVGKG